MCENLVKKRTKIIQCERCGVIFKNLRNLRNHFDRKHICKAILKDISIEELKEKNKVKRGCYKCENCGKEYKTSDGKYKHKKKCLENPIILESNIISKLENELETVKNEKNKEIIKRKELEKQVEKLLFEKTQLKDSNSNMVINGNSNITTIGRDQNIIILNNFGEENLEHLLKDENFIKRCIESPINSIHRYLDNVHFNKDYPENRNIKVNNLLGPYMDYIKEGRWNKIEKKILIPKIVNNSIDVIDNIIYNREDINEEDLEDDKLEEWEDYKYKNNKDKKLKDKICSKTNRQIYNNSTI